MKNTLIILLSFFFLSSCNYTERQKKLSNMEIAPGGHTALELPTDMQEKLLPYKEMSVEIVWPKYAEQEIPDIKFWKKDPEAYAERQNRNVQLYTQSVLVSYVSGSKTGDTVQLKYRSHVTYPQTSNFQLVHTKGPLEEYRTQEGDATLVEYLKGVVRELK